MFLDCYRGGSMAILSRELSFVWLNFVLRDCLIWYGFMLFFFFELILGYCLVF